MRAYRKAGMGRKGRPGSILRGLGGLEAALALSLLLSLGVAQRPVGATVRLTVTQQDLALVEETRSLEVPVGEGLEVVVEDLARSLDPKSVKVVSTTAPDAFRVRTQRFRRESTDPAALLEGFVGRRVRVMIPDPNGPAGARVTRDAVLLSGSERPALAIDGQVYLGACDALWLPEVPMDFGVVPALIWTVDNRHQGPQDLALTYLTASIGWDAAYRLTLEGPGGAALLEGSLVVRNYSGRAYRSVEIQALAGSLRVLPGLQAGAGRLRAETAAAPTMAPAEAISEASVFEYHLYRLPGVYDLPDRQELQIDFLHARPLSIERELISRGRALFGFRPPAAGFERPQEVLIHLRFDNRSGAALGEPLPGGDLSAYQRLGDGRMVLIGQDRIQATPVGGRVELTLGRAFDVQVRRKLLGYEQVDKTAVRVEWELTVSNGKETAERVLLDEEFGGDWKVLEAGAAYQTLDAATVRFGVEVPAGGTRTVRYSAQIGRE